MFVQASTIKQNGQRLPKHPSFSTFRVIGVLAFAFMGITISLHSEQSLNTSSNQTILFNLQPLGATDSLEGFRALKEEELTVRQNANIRPPILAVKYLNGIIERSSNRTIDQPETIQIIAQTIESVVFGMGFIDVLMGAKIDQANKEIDELKRSNRCEGLPCQQLFVKKTSANIIIDGDVFLEENGSYRIELQLIDFREGEPKPISTTFFSVDQMNLTKIRTNFTATINQYSFFPDSAFKEPPQLSKVGIQAISELGDALEDMDIYINGLYIGATPFADLSLSTGIYTVHLVHQYMDEKRILEIKESGQYFLRILTVVPLGILSVETFPTECLVYLDGYYIGKSPIKRKVPFGKHSLKLIKNFHQSMETSFEMIQDQLELLKKLQPTGLVKIRDIPLEAEVIFHTPEGETLIKHGNSEIYLPEGNWNVTIHAPNYQQYKNHLYVPANEIVYYKPPIRLDEAIINACQEKLKQKRSIHRIIMIGSGIGILTSFALSGFMIDRALTAKRHGARAYQQYLAIPATKFNPSIGEKYQEVQNYYKSHNRSMVASYFGFASATVFSALLVTSFYTMPSLDDYQRVGCSKLQVALYPTMYPKSIEGQVSYTFRF